MKLIDELRADTIDSKISLTNALRKAKVLASILKNKGFQNWVNSELNGYQSYDDVPEYRKTAVQVLGTFVGPYGARIDNVMVPLFNLPETLKDFARENSIFAHGVKELESMVDKDTDVLRARWPAEAVILARDGVKMEGGYVLADAWQQATRSTIEGILDTVRNRLLDFVLELQEISPTIRESEDAISELPKDRVETIYNVTILGEHNVVATGSGIDQRLSQQVTLGDWDGLREYYRGLGVPDEDLDELESAINHDEKSNSKQLGEKVKLWVGSMISKSIEGAWKVSVAAAPKLIIDGLSKYYGWRQ